MKLLEQRRAYRVKFGVAKKASAQAATRRGAALVEFALVAPILIFTTMVMVQFGIILNAQINLSNIARQTARFAAVNATKAGSDNTIKQYGINTAAAYCYTLTNTNLILTPGESSRERGVEARLTLNYDLSRLYFLPVRFWGDSSNSVPFVRTNYSTTTTFLLE